MPSFYYGHKRKKCSSADVKHTMLGENQREEEEKKLEKVIASQDVWQTTKRRDVATREIQ